MRFFFRRFRKQRSARATGRQEYLKHREFARARIIERLQYWSDTLNLRYNRVAIRNQGTRWGSCSSKGNLNFNYRIAFLPETLMDYVIVHELCHLAHFNHSRAFWDMLANILPDYEPRKRLLQHTHIRSFQKEITEGAHGTI